MKILTAFARFYKSLNYDYIRKSHRDAKPQPWELIDGRWYPFVRVSLEPDVTTVVGANESGKTHLLKAIAAGLKGSVVSGIDFCRHSEFFSVETGKSRVPDFGFEFSEFAEHEKLILRQVLSLKEDVPDLTSVYYFRLNGEPVMYYREGPDWNSVTLDVKAVLLFQEIIPEVHSIEPSVGLPDSIPLVELIDFNDEESSGLALPSGEQARAFDSLLKDGVNLSKPQYVKDNAESIAQKFSSLLHVSTTSRDDHATRASQYEIARTLIYHIARIDPKKIKELYDSALIGETAYVSALTSSINSSLADNLDFQRWWTQDDQFQLRVTADGLNLCFCIRDRTQRDYLFRERSSGLKYFLGYLIQYLSFKPSTSKASVVLMDEPDAFLSNAGQQSLLQLFEAFASSSESINSRQVIYVTHSPFLIDKNKAWRIRVIEKGIEDDGTRVIRDASHNRYEPLRSSLGIFVGETAFISGCNLMVEGLGDQVLLVGLNSYLRKRNHYSGDTLNLNELTIVPAGGAENVPYMVQLAVGRDAEKPAVVAFLDGDADGKTAAKAIVDGKMLSDEFVLTVEHLKDEGVTLPRDPALESIIPPRLFFASGIRYLELLKQEQLLPISKIDDFVGEWKPKEDPYKVLSKCATSGSGLTVKFAKVGLLKCVVEILNNPSISAVDLTSELQQIEVTGKLLLSWLNSKIRKAVSNRKRDELRVKIKQARKRFFRDNPNKASRSSALALIDHLVGLVDNDLAYSDSRLELLTLKRDIDPEGDQSALIDNFPEFLAVVGRVENINKLSQEMSAGGLLSLAEFHAPLDVAKVSTKS